MYTDSSRNPLTDKRFEQDESASQYRNHVFIRLSAKGRKFTNVDFRYSTFDSCYLRNAQFDSCDFTGCRFLGSNLHGATFSGCKFDYASFERTTIDPTILDTEYPKPENLRARFARTLRMNFAQLGDVASANKAMKLELEATGIHCRKAVFSEEKYYRSKYTGVLWWRALYDLLLFHLGDFVWGNGESLGRLLRCVLLVLIAMTIFDVVKFGNPNLMNSWGTSFARSFQVFMGAPFGPIDYPQPYVGIITLVRLIAIAFLVSIIFKKFNRR
ncbi:pentapeptide repeat-containing protein [Pannonibacter indicus]|uniref:pentapeptide repeat-containing protein n=1 Tax=Pannonibacter indicus TaxID=466044 RepID=UPI0035B48A78